jgi:hypothetical protein
MSSLIAAFLVAAIAVAVLARFRLRPASVLRGMTSAPAKADLFRQPGSPLRIAGCCHWMFTRHVPASTILVDAQSMAGRDMLSEHLAVPAASRQMT